MPHDLSVGIALDDVGQLIGPDGSARDLADRLDRSGVSHVVLGLDRTTAAAPVSPSPTIAGTFLARRTRHVGIAVLASPQRDHPYNIARRVASLDHVSQGRAAWLTAGHDSSTSLGLEGASAWADAPLDATATADAVTAVRRLWRSWPASTLDDDPDVAHTIDIPYADHVGVFSTRGPLTVPTTPQGEPLVIWALATAQEVAPALESADVVIVEERDLGAVLEAYRSRGPGGDVPLIHVRAGDAPVAALIDRWSREPFVSGLVLDATSGSLTGRLDELAVLPSQAWRPVDVSRPPTTLRDRLGVPRRLEPDLSQNPTAFPALAKVPS